MAHNALLHLQRGPAVVQLNVGGTTFCTSRETLLKPESAGLRELLVNAEDGSLLLDTLGRLFVDSNPRTFEVVLDFLRDGAAALPASQFELQKLLIDARKFQIHELAAQVLAALVHPVEQPNQMHPTQGPSAMQQESSMETASDLTVHCKPKRKRRAAWGSSKAHPDVAQKAWETDNAFKLPRPLPDGSTHWPIVDPGNRAADHTGRVRCRLCLHFGGPASTCSLGKDSQFTSDEGYTGGRKTSLFQHQTRNMQHLAYLQQLRGGSEGPRQLLASQQGASQQAASPQRQETEGSQAQAAVATPVQPSALHRQHVVLQAASPLPAQHKPQQMALLLLTPPNGSLRPTALLLQQAPPSAGTPARLMPQRGFPAAAVPAAAAAARTATPAATAARPAAAAHSFGVVPAASVAGRPSGRSDAAQPPLPAASVTEHTGGSAGSGAGDTLSTPSRPLPGPAERPQSPTSGPALGNAGSLQADAESLFQGAGSATQPQTLLSSGAGASGGGARTGDSLAPSAATPAPQQQAVWRPEATPRAALHLRAEQLQQQLQPPGAQVAWRPPFTPGAHLPATPQEKLQQLQRHLQQQQQAQRQLMSPVMSPQVLRHSSVNVPPGQRPQLAAARSAMPRCLSFPFDPQRAPLLPPQQLMRQPLQPPGQPQQQLQKQPQQQLQKQPQQQQQLRQQAALHPGHPLSRQSLSECLDHLFSSSSDMGQLHGPALSGRPSQQLHQQQPQQEQAPQPALVQPQPAQPQQLPPGSTGPAAAGPAQVQDGPPPGPLPLPILPSQAALPVVPASQRVPPLPAQPPATSPSNEQCEEEPHFVDTLLAHHSEEEEQQQQQQLLQLGAAAEGQGQMQAAASLSGSPPHSQQVHMARAASLGLGLLSAGSGGSTGHLSPLSQAASLPLSGGSGTPPGPASSSEPVQPAHSTQLQPGPALAGGDVQVAVELPPPLHTCGGDCGSGDVLEGLDESFLQSPTTSLLCDLLGDSSPTASTRLPAHLGAQLPGLDLPAATATLLGPDDDSALCALPDGLDTPLAQHLAVASPHLPPLPSPSRAGLEDMGDGADRGPANNLGLGSGAHPHQHPHHSALPNVAPEAGGEAGEGGVRDTELLQLIHQSSIGASLPLLADLEELS